MINSHMNTVIDEINVIVSMGYPIESTMYMILNTFMSAAIAEEFSLRNTHLSVIKEHTNNDLLIRRVLNASESAFYMYLHDDDYLDDPWSIVFSEIKEKVQLMDRAPGLQPTLKETQSPEGLVLAQHTDVGSGLSVVQWYRDLHTNHPNKLQKTVLMIIEDDFSLACAAAYNQLRITLELLPVNPVTPDSFQVISWLNGKQRPIAAGGNDRHGVRSRLDGHH